MSTSSFFIVCRKQPNNAALHRREHVFNETPLSLSLTVVVGGGDVVVGMVGVDEMRVCGMVFVVRVSVVVCGRAIPVV